MDRDLVTIVIPAYNAEQCLCEGIESILNQTYRNLEIICVCDGCTDRTAEILLEYASKDPRMVVQIELENHGAAVSRNIGMNMAHGEWIAFWDADDLYEHNAIEELLRAAVEESADLACCYWEYFDDIPDRNRGIDNWLKKLYCSTYPIINTREELHHIMQLAMTVPCNKLIHKSLYTKDEVFFQDIPNVNDVYFSKVVAMSSYKMVYVDKVFYHYRSNRGRHTLSTERDTKKNYLFVAYHKIYEYIRQKEDNLPLLKSFYNDVITNLNIYLGDPGYDVLFDSLRNVYFEKWGMLGHEIPGKLSCINRAYYKNILDNNKNISLQDIYMQARVEFMRELSYKGCSVWGTGQMGKALLEEISKTDINIQHVFDSAQDKWGRQVCGFVVENFSEVHAEHIVITTPKFYDEIVKSIEERADHIYNLEQQIWLIPEEENV
ncbi:MAG: glycosyltransferase family 2 protein [Lachnospiraceae bacterium]|nr:glycosyltransferase family 2 protein [Lachnospiraceae bacterium]